jgi:hypothetical protein
MADTAKIIALAKIEGSINWVAFVDATKSFINNDLQIKNLDDLNTFAQLGSIVTTVLGVNQLTQLYASGVALSTQVMSIRDKKSRGLDVSNTEYLSLLGNIVSVISGIFRNSPALRIIGAVITTIGLISSNSELYNKLSTSVQKMADDLENLLINNIRNYISVPSGDGNLLDGFNPNNLGFLNQNANSAVYN